MSRVVDGIVILVVSAFAIAMGCALFLFFVNPASPSRVDHVYACVDLRNGRMDLKTGPRAYSFPCGSSETAVSWVVKG